MVDAGFSRNLRDFSLISLGAFLAAYVFHAHFVSNILLPSLCLTESGTCIFVKYRAKGNAAIATLEPEGITVFFNGQHAYLYLQGVASNDDRCGTNSLVYRLNRTSGKPFVSRVHQTFCRS